MPAAPHSDLDRGFARASRYRGRAGLPARPSYVRSRSRSRLPRTHTSTAASLAQAAIEVVRACPHDRLTSDLGADPTSPHSHLDRNLVVAAVEHPGAEREGVDSRDDALALVSQPRTPAGNRRIA